MLRNRPSSPPGTRKLQRRAERALEVAFDFEGDDRLDRAAVLGPLRVDRGDAAADDRARVARQLAEIGGNNHCGPRRQRQREEHTTHRQHSHAFSVTHARLKSSRDGNVDARQRERLATERVRRGRRAGSLPPRGGWRPGRRAARARVARPARMRAARSRSVSIEIASRRDRLRRERVLHQLRHDRLAGDQVHHADRVDLDERGAASRYDSGDTGRRSPSACRAAPSAPSRCRTRSARRRTTRAPCRCRLRRSATGATVPRPPARTAIEQRLVEVRRARDDELRAGHARRGCARRPRQGRAGSATPRSAGCPAGWRRSAPTAPSRAPSETSPRVADGIARSTAGGRRTPPARRPSR